MAKPIWRVVYDLTIFGLTKIPFANALSLLMLLAERAKRESYPPLAPKLVYAHVGLFVVCGVCMSARILRKEVAMVYAGQLAFFAYSIYTSDRLGYKECIMTRMALRSLGCLGVYITLAHDFDRHRGQFLKRLSANVIGVYAFGCAFTLHKSEVEREVFLKNIAGGTLVLNAVILVYLVVAFTFIWGSYRDYTGRAALAMIVVVTTTTFLVDADFSYWRTKGRQDFWNQVRLIIDNACVVIGLVFIYIRSSNYQGS